MTKEMVWEGLLEREQDSSDGRVHRLRATEKGIALLQEGRRKRVEVLSDMLSTLSERERRLLARAAQLLEQLTLPEGHPGQTE
jgi:DNA-binding MarR family transcriptional regulator